MTRPIDLRFELAAARRVVGTWCITPSAALVEAAARAGLDFELLDLEHGVFDPTTLEACVRAAELGGAVPLVRVPTVDPAVIQVALDVGAHGIVVPQVRGLDDVRAAVAATRYAPVGTRGFNPFTRGSGYGVGGAERPDPFVMIIIEHPAAVEALPAIVAEPGVDAVYLGVYDMSVALGVPGQVSSPIVERFVEEAVATARAAGCPVGGMATTPDGVVGLVRRGIDLAVFGVDVNVYAATMATAVAAVAQEDG
jgi:4-hydroxy-2-oxoheptanedioate aldolase